MEDYFSDKTHFVVNVRVTQRNGRKMITHIDNFPPEYDLVKILRYIKKIYKCGGAILKDKREEGAEVLQLSGDQRQNVYDFFTKYNVLDKHNIKVHGA